MNPSQEYEETGRVWFRGALNRSEQNNLNVFEASKSGHGYRPDLSLLKTGLFTRFGPIQNVTAGLLRNKKPVRIVAFNKQADANWAVPWHQDRVIAAKDLVDDPRFSNWTRQQNYWHCEPPIETFDEMVVIRIHLDDCSEGGGPMELALKSHLLGSVLADRCAEEAQVLDKDQGIAKAGDILVFHPLLLHRSQKASNPVQRRVLRIDYAPNDLVTGLEWAVEAA